MYDHFKDIVNFIKCQQHPVISQLMKFNMFIYFAKLQQTMKNNFDIL